MDNKRSCCCGVFPKGLWWLLTLLGLPLLYFLMFNANKDSIEADLTQRVSNALTAENMAWADVSVDERGRDVFLTGEAPSAEAKDKVVALAKSVTGVRIAEGEFTDFVAVEDMVLNIALEDGKIVLNGSVGSQAEIDEIVKAATDRVGEGNVVNNLTINKQVKMAGWLGALPGLMGLALEGGSLSASAEGIKYTGIVESQDMQDTLLGKAKKLLASFNIPVINGLVIEESGPSVAEIKAAEDAKAAAEAEVAKAVEVKSAEEAKAATAEVEEAINVCQNKLNEAMSGKIIHFQTNAAVIQQQSHALLNQIATVMAECKDEISGGISINGHTDSRGEDAYNMALSLRRAGAVKSYLEQHNVSSSLMKSVGHGETSPIASNDTREGQAENRRITFIINER